MKHLFIDFETMGQNPIDCAVIDCSVFVADTDKMLSDKPYTCRTFGEVKKFKFSIKDQVQNYDWIVYPDSVNFWSQQSEDVRQHIKPKADDLTMPQFSKEFFNYLISAGKIDYWWSRSNTFDPIILDRMFRSLGQTAALNSYLMFWRVRDIRTFIDAKFNFSTLSGFVPINDEEFWKKVFQEHNSQWDVLADVLRFQAILRAENDLENISK